VDQPVGSDDREIDTEANQYEAEGREWPGDRDLEVLARGRRVAAHLGQPAEQEQVDPPDHDSVVARHQRVAQLVD
jgi:hypothetical protein